MACSLNAFAAGFICCLLLGLVTWLAWSFFQLGHGSFLALDLGEEEARKIKCFVDLDRRKRGHP